MAGSIISNKSVVVIGIMTHYKFMFLTWLIILLQFIMTAYISFSSHDLLFNLYLDEFILLLSLERPLHVSCGFELKI